MNRYTAEPQPERGRYRIENPWMITVSSGGKPIIDLTEAEAKIAAWAYNQIADGNTLSTGCLNAASSHVYDGPIKGVRW